MIFCFTGVSLYYTAHKVIQCFHPTAIACGDNEAMMSLDDSTFRL